MVVRDLLKRSALPLKAQKLGIPISRDTGRPTMGLDLKINMGPAGPSAGDRSRHPTAERCRHTERRIRSIA